MKSIATIFLLVWSFSAGAQLHSSAFHVGWSILKPLSDKDYIDKTSAAGMRIGYSKFLNNKFGVGLEGAYATLNDYIPRQTYEYPGGAYTTDFHTYLYYFTLMANAQYYIVQGKHFIPYASLGMGIAFSEYRIFYNVYADNDSRQSFTVRPEVGTLFKVKEYSNWGFKGAVSYDFAANRSSYFDVKDFSAIGLNIGVVFFTD
jgi:opacity protein-like surface antigen